MTEKLHNVLMKVKYIKFDKKQSFFEKRVAKFADV